MLEIKTFGCRLNFFESEMIRKMLENESGTAGWCVFNSCAITGEAFRQLKQQIRKYSRENTGKLIFVTGCSAQVEFDELSKMDEIFKVIDNKNKLERDAYFGDAKMVASAFGGNEIQCLPTPNQIPEKFIMHTKAFVQIQQGCNNFCTYCIVTYTRGRSVNFSKELIFQQFETFLKNGYKELTITGVDIASYENNGENLTFLINEILEQFKDQDFRLRLSSIDPAYNDFDGIFSLMKSNHKLTPFLHLSVQSGDNVVLKSMNRKHSVNDLRALIRRGRESVENIAFGADLIMGFYSETDELFQNTYKLIEELKIEHLHVFPYSVRPLTASYLMGDPVPVLIKKERVAKILEMNKKILDVRMGSMVGEIVEVLSEGKWGYTDNYFKVLIDDESTRGKIVKKELKSVFEAEYFTI